MRICDRFISFLDTSYTFCRYCVLRVVKRLSSVVTGDAAKLVDDAVGGDCLAPSGWCSAISTHCLVPKRVVATLIRWVVLSRSKDVL